MEYSDKLYKRFGISRSTAERYVEAYETVQTIGAPVYDAARKSGLNVGSIPVRETLSGVKKKHPKASPTEIVKLTNLELAKPKEVTPPPTPSFNIADFTAEISQLRLTLSGLSKHRSSPEETKTLVRNLRTLAKDAEQAANKLEVAA